MWYCQLSRVFFKVAIITLGFQRSDDDTILTEEREWLAQTKSSLQPGLGWLLQISKQKIRSWADWLAGWISWWTPILFLSWRRNIDSAYQFASLWLGNLLVSYQIEISRPAGGGFIFLFPVVAAGGGSPYQPPCWRSLFRPLPVPSYKLLWHEFPRPGLLTGAAYDVNTGWWEEHTMLVLPIGLSCRGCRRRMWTEIIWLSSDTSG